MAKCQGFSWDALAEQAICRREGTWMQEAHTGVCVQEKHLFLPASFDHTGARAEFWCCHVSSSTSTWSLAGFTKAIQHPMEQTLNGSHVAQASLFL